MANPQELADKVAEVAAVVDAEQQEVADAIAARDAAIAERDAAIAEKDQVIATQVAAIEALNQTIADLEAQLANSASPEQLQAAVDSLNAIKADLEATV